jgi:hypothetical protein
MTAFLQGGSPLALSVEAVPTTTYDCLAGNGEGPQGLLPASRAGPVGPANEKSWIEANGWVLKGCSRQRANVGAV